VTEQAPAIKLLLNSKEAAQALGIGERLLWTWTHPRGSVPCVRIGRAVRYSPDALRAFIQERMNGGNP
jgi:predicted DNA-binding transcriptional regulator AlpA